MLNRIKSILAGQDAAAARGPTARDDLQAAAAALLVEAARMDDALGPAERERIVQLVRWRFALSDEEAECLVEEAEQEAARSVQNYGFAAIIRRRCTDTERVQLIEMLWDVAYADGQLHDLEASLLRRIAGLLYVSDQESGAARKRVMARHGLSGTGAAP